MYTYIDIYIYICEELTTDNQHTWYYFELMGPWRVPNVLIYSDNVMGFSGNGQANHVGVYCFEINVLFGFESIE